MANKDIRARIFQRLKTCRVSMESETWGSQAVEGRRAVPAHLAMAQQDRRDAGFCL